LFKDAVPSDGYVECNVMLRSDLEGRGPCEHCFICMGTHLRQVGVRGQETILGVIKGFISEDCGKSRPSTFKPSNPNERHETSKGVLL
jgi:hypothetical protein